MTRKNRNGLIVIVVLAIPVLIFVGSAFHNAFTVPSAEPMPNPNGYDDLVKAGQMLPTNFPDYTTLSQDDLQKLVASDSNALQLARAGLQEQSRVSLDDTMGSTNSPDWLMGLKRVGLAFAAEGRLEELQGHNDEAAKSYLDLIHCANDSSGGGVVIDELTGLAMENMGTTALEKLLPKLDAKTCRATATALETLDAQRQTWDEVMQQEYDWSRRMHHGLAGEWNRFLMRKSLNVIYNKTQQTFNRQLRSTRQLILDLAARAYQLDKGHAPAGAADLVPAYLKAVPIDPFTGTNLVYAPR